MSEPTQISPWVWGGLGVTVVALFSLGWSMAAPSQSPFDEPKTEASASANPSRPARISNRESTPSPARIQVAAIRALPTQSEQLRATYALVESLSLEELAKWLEGRWFEHVDDYNLSFFNKLAEKRWQREDPEGFQLWKIRQGGGSAWDVFSEWAQSDPARLIDYFREHPDPTMELQHLESLAKRDPAMVALRIQEMFSEGSSLWGSNGTQEYRLEAALRAIIAADPTLAEGLMSKLPAKFARKLEDQLTARKLQESFHEGLQDLIGREDGWKVFTRLDFEGKGDRLLEEIDQLPPNWIQGIAENPYSVVNAKNAGAWFQMDLEGLGVSHQSANRLRARALNYLGRENIEEGIRMLRESDFSLNERRNVLANWAHLIPADQQSTLLSGFSEEEMALVKNRTDLVEMSEEQRDFKPNGPDEWFAAAAEGKIGYSMFETLRSWDSEKQTAFLEGYRHLPEEQRSKVAKGLMENGHRLGPNLTGEVIRDQLSLADEENQNIPIQAAKLAVQWVNDDPVAASQWVNSLPPGQGRSWAQQNLVRNWMLNDPEASEQWLQALPAAEQREVRTFLEEHP
ncbi:hypothetical protein HNR46_000287 [Haloferula luteola]|uniref:Uncharacterized protein n=1 Tax=Haloferula luteola TaxID=595692 RepID=A0A840UZ13_9BACT|nr:hypothetical protein [Haloferula luteola]MBB5350066.1 hypothetical protein [Haloferula luteola]